MPDEPVTWSVGKQLHTSWPDDNGQAVSGVLVPVLLSTGESFELRVPAAVYADPAKVAQTVQAAVDHHVEVSRLTGTAG